MSYLASFLSRSAVITPQQVGQDFNIESERLVLVKKNNIMQVLAHLGRLSSWAHSYVRTRESQDCGLDFMYTDLAK